MKPAVHDHVAAALGDNDALAALVSEYHDRVYRYGVRVCHDSFDADDAVQEAFILLAKRPDVAKDQGALSWLMTVVRNTCRRLLRPFLRESRALGDRVEDPAEISADHISAQQALERFELVRSVHSAIAGLEPMYREVLVLRDLEGLNAEDTCAALGLELSAMKSRLLRARQQLKEQLKNYNIQTVKGELN